MLQLALRTLRFRTGTFVAAFIAMFFAAIVLMACGGLIETGIRAAVPPQQLGSADVVVAGEQTYHAPGGDEDEPAVLPERVRVDASLEHVIAALPGVRETDTYVFEGTPPAGTVDAIGVAAEPGADVAELRTRIDAELDATTSTLVGDERGRAELRGATATSVNVVSLAGVFTAFALLVSIFGVASMLGLSIAQRNKELALLRAIGATPRQVRTLIFRETLVLSLVATAAAYLPGQLLGGFVFDLLAEQGIATAGVAFHQGWIPSVAATVVAVLAALGGALGAGRRAARTKPSQALSEASLDGRLISGWRFLAGLLFVAAGVALTIVTVTALSGPLAPATAAPAVIVLTIGLAMLAPVLAKVMIVAIQWPVRALGGLTGDLAVLNARGRTSRLAAVLGPVILLTGVSTGMLYLQTTNDAADKEAYAAGIVADAVVTAEGGVDPRLVEEIGRLPGVAGASAYVSSVGFVESPDDVSPMGEGWNLQGVTAQGAAATTPVDVTAGALTDLQGATVAIEEGHAGRLGVDVGDTITLRMGDSSLLDVRVAALFSAAEDYDTLLLPAQTLADHTTAGVPTRALVTAQDGTDPEQLVATLTGLAATRDGLTVADREILFDEYEEQKKTASYAIYIMVLMLVGYSAITTINTLVSSTSARQREFGLQRLVGSTRRQVLQMVGVEAAIVAVTGVVLGTVAALGILVPLSVDRLGSLIPAGPPLAYVAIVGLVALLTLGATLLPARRVTRGRAAEAAVSIE
ncbi:FtsX-like permease family protein [Promicromonospora thailandica]|uniref:ABC transport system permease protein n=1 Tax=Promicromonospora thailandica TaxID=765201 RepID=A0A9X2G5S3_9MICO|nr:ABC transporter permease [Promicromonospora thailandica]MCP2266198.1 putative ABC transport system permease protein [Promicromonospora thailandica]